MGESNGRSASTPTLLMVGFDARFGGSLDADLRREGFRLLSARNRHEAFALLSEKRPSLALIHLDPIDPAGLHVCKELRVRSLVPIILVSSQDREADAVAGLDAGADDYVSQPQRFHELVARIRAALRRSPLAPPPEDRQVIRVGDVVLDPARHEVRVRDLEIELPLREFEVLEVLIANPGRVWTRQALMRRVWGETPASGTKSLDVHIRRIRARIEDDPSTPTRIVTVRGVGYKYAGDLARD